MVKKLKHILYQNNGYTLIIAPTSQVSLGDKVELIHPKTGESQGVVNVTDYFYDSVKDIDLHPNGLCLLWFGVGFNDLVKAFMFRNANDASFRLYLCKIL